MSKKIIILAALVVAFTFGSIGTAKYLKFKRAASQINCEFASPVPNKELTIVQGYRNGALTKLRCYLD